MAKTVEQVCQEKIRQPTLVAGCNLFVIEVAKAFDYGDAVGGDADAIVNAFPSSPFIYIGMSPDQATARANEGNLVIGGLTRSGMTYTQTDGHIHRASMGHVVVVVGGGPSAARTVQLMNGRTQAARGGYPYCYQGAANAPYRFTQKTQVDVVFPSALLDKVVYAYLPIPKH